MKQYRVLLVALLGLISTACYSKFEMPADTTIYTDESFEEANPDLQHITIAEMKEIFNNTHGSISGTGTNDKGVTKYVHFVKSEADIEDKSDKVGNYYIKGKVLSNDEQGNIYKSLYIFDGTASIELKLTNGLHLDYPCDLETKESMWVYVKLCGLYLGNFRMMLSLGDIPTSSLNAWGSYKYYANSNIVSQHKVKQFVFAGEKTTLTEGTSPTDDIYVVDSSSYHSIQGDNTEKFLARLIRFKGLKVRYCGVKNHLGETPEPLYNGSFEQIYPSWLCTSGIQTTLPPTAGGQYTQVVNQPWYKLSYSVNNVCLYGSLCLSYNDNAKYTSDPGLYMMRTSGYARFSGKYVPMDGTVGDVLAIFQIYSKQSTFLGGSNDYATYQIAINRIEDFEFETEPKEAYAAWSSHIAWAEDNFPQYTYPISDYTKRNELVALWKANYEANKPANDGSELWQKWNTWGDWVVWILENTPEYSYILPQQIVEEDDTME